MSQLRLTHKSHNHDHKIDITKYKRRKKSMRTNFQKIKY
jgi:ribosomal protein L21